MIPPHQSLTRQTACSFLPTQGEAFLHDSFRATHHCERAEICNVIRYIMLYLLCMYNVKKASPRGEAVATATDEGGYIRTYKRHTLSLRIPPTNRARSRTLQKSPTSPNDKNFPPRAPAPYKAKQNFALHRRVLLGGSSGRMREVWREKEPPPKGGSFSLQGLCSLPHCAASTIAVNFSGTRDAPPIKPPSTFVLESSSAAFFSFIEPPY